MSTVTNHKARTYRIVGPQRQIDERETPHPRADRGELGERTRMLRKTRAGGDVLRRTFGGGNEMKGGKNNSLRYVMRQVPEGGVSPERIPVSDPAAMARKIKEVARFFGADVVGICHLDQTYVYSHRASARATDGKKPGDPINLPHQYAICLAAEEYADTPALGLYQAVALDRRSHLGQEALALHEVDGLRQRPGACDL
ncbi:hypothetical protein ACFL0M_02945 [Thermodesulfobacteriota bacterium]